MKPSPATAAAASPGPVPERWRTDAGAADLALLDIPPALRGRRFDIDVRFEVRCPDDPARESWHALTVELDGRRQWQRRVPGATPGDVDGLDYHCRVDVPAGAGLRVRALTQLRGSVRRRLLIEAEEVPQG